jgi:hypothetical protein
MADEDRSGLDVLLAMVETAQRFASRLASDPLVGRLLRVFEKLPVPDREPIVRILEREAAWCRIAEQTADTTGITVRPNPHASLYVHVCEPVEGPLRRDIDVIRSGLERYVHLAPLLYQEGVHAQWTASARELARDASPELRAHVARLARDVLALIDEADTRGAAPADTSVPDPEPAKGAQRDRR